MNRFIASAICLIAACGAFAEDNDLAEFESVGGALVKPGTYIGKVTIVNCQNELPSKEVVAVAKLLENVTELRFEVVSKKYDQPENLLKATGAAVVAVVISDKSKPTILAAPEDRWCVINLAKLVDDLPAERAKQKFFPTRARKEIIKGISLVCGGGSSQYPQNIMNTSSVRELDQAKEQVPADMIAHYVTYLKKLGVKQKVIVTYEDACQEGWAPAPTNAVQKAIWDKVHAPPKNPMKIEFDPKKGR